MTTPKLRLIRPPCMGEDILVATFQKNSLETVKIRLTEFKGEALIDIRVWMKNPTGEDEIPTTKGITVRRELFDELKAGILKLGEALNG